MLRFSAPHCPHQPTAGHLRVKGERGEGDHLNGNSSVVDDIREVPVGLWGDAVGEEFGHAAGIVPSAVLYKDQKKTVQVDGQGAQQRDQVVEVEGNGKQAVIFS